MTLWELAAYFAVFLGGVAGGWITCAVFTAARVNELSSEAARAWGKLRDMQAQRDRAEEERSQLELELQLAQASLEEEQEFHFCREQLVQGAITAAAIVALQKLLKKPPTPAAQASNASA
jgi:hypothetical protein